MLDFFVNNFKNHPFLKHLGCNSLIFKAVTLTLSLGLTIGKMQRIQKKKRPIMQNIKPFSVTRQNKTNHQNPKRILLNCLNLQCQYQPATFQSNATKRNHWESLIDQATISWFV